MFRWTLLFQTPAAKQLAERLSERARAALAQGRKAPERRAPSGCAAAAARVDDRERLLEQALRLAVVEDYRELSAPQIADAAGVPIDAFFELFDGKQECFLAALDMLGEELMALACDPDLRSEDWPNAVRRTIGEMMRFLAEQPIYAQTIAGGVYRGRAGGDRTQRSPGAGHRRAPDRRRSGRGAAELVVQGVAGALSHTVRCQVASGQIQLLSVLADYLSYIVLAPFLGAEQAAALVIEQA